MRVLSQSAIDEAVVEQSRGPDAVLGLPTRFGLGFWLTMPELPMGPSARSFGHGGFGGSVGFADPDARVGVGYTMNKMLMGDDLRDPRSLALGDAIYRSL
jgi:CubicO group peptidase (beta-lactamase class C family)